MSLGRRRQMPCHLWRRRPGELSCVLNRGAGMSGDAQTDAEFRLALNRVYRWYAAGFIAFVLVLAFF